MEVVFGYAVDKNDEPDHALGQFVIDRHELRRRLTRLWLSERLVVRGALER